MEYQRKDFKRNDDRSFNRNFSAPTEDWSIKVKPEWITNELDHEGIEFSEKLGKLLADQSLSTSQIRNIFGEMKRIQMKGFDKEKTAFLLLLPKVAYAAKRNEKQGIKTFKTVFDKIYSHVKSEKEFENMMNLMEAILAYHKANENKSNN